MIWQEVNMKLEYELPIAQIVDFRVIEHLASAYGVKNAWDRSDDGGTIDGPGLGSDSDGYEEW